MPRIVTEVQTGYLVQNPEEEAILSAFLTDFDITWARRRNAFGSNLGVYFLKPAPHMERAFGFEAEILALYSDYESLEPRTMQALTRFLSDEPARGRVDTMVAFLISEANSPVSWVQQYMTAHPDSMLIAAFEAPALRAGRSDSWVVRSRLSEQLYQRDLFDHRLPLRSDSFFFGREDLIYDFYTALRRSENRGLFGLRKTGKTSVFFKLERRVKAAGDDIFIYLDCKYPPIRQLRWEQLLFRLARDLAKQAGREEPSPSVHASDAFLEGIEGVAGKRQIALVFDEVEYIGPFNPIDPHWREDFIPFWQSIWAAQSRFGNLAVFLGGVNPGIVEQDLVEGSPNPLFGIVHPKYLGGLGMEATRRMLRTLGRPMGLRFAPEAVDYIFARYGGHPLLTRMACSIIHGAVREAREELPATVGASWLQITEGQRESELSFYCGHIVSELRQFYRDEYEVLRELAVGGLADIFEFTSDPTFTAHLNNYGLLARDDAGRPSISIPVLEHYLGRQAAREAGRQTIVELVEEPGRQRWVKRRIKTINQGLEDLQRDIGRVGSPWLFGPHSYPESYKFFDLTPVEEEADFASFINVCNRCFVEPIDGYGNAIGKPKYFWEEISKTYPALSEALRRIRVYRNDRVHIKLNPKASRDLHYFLTRDLGGSSAGTVEHLWFQLQQCVLDDLLVCILVEIDRLT